MITYQKILNDAKLARMEGVDIVALEEPEYTETRNFLIKQARLVPHWIHNIDGYLRRSGDTFEFRGIQFVKQE